LFLHIEERQIEEERITWSQVRLPRLLTQKSGARESILQQGDPQAAEELVPLVYGELRKLAAAMMANEPAGSTLQPTALVHETWLRLAASQNQHWAGRAHSLSSRRPSRHSLPLLCRLDLCFQPWTSRNDSDR
jgi:hypothetical protein